MKIQEFQQLIDRVYGDRDRARGLAGTHMWFSEEVGELARALRRNKGNINDHAALEGEFADVLAWLSTLASMSGVDLEKAALDKYGKGCPRCNATPCKC
ncbi:MAG: MazG nucleotide pyrophosphohydrolase domain-containing protein [Planctomycetota bacterium]